jgi:signal transduction histidine kinase
VRQSGLDRGATEYLRKPFDMNELNARADNLIALRVLQRRRAEDEKVVDFSLAVSGVAHELGNIVSRMSGPTAVIARELAGGGSGDPAVLDRHAELLNRGFAQLANIVESLRSAPVTEPGPPVPTGILETAERVAETETRERTGAEIILEIDPTDRILSRDGILERILRGLIRNGRESAGPDGRVTMTAERDSASADDLVISVADDGPGIPEEAIERVFEPFFSRKGGGTNMGIGLYLARRLAEREGWVLTVENNPGGGATSRIRIIEGA